MSVEIDTADCCETIDEARGVIRRQASRIAELEAELAKAQAAFDSEHELVLKKQAEADRLRQMYEEARSSLNEDPHLAIRQLQENVKDRDEKVAGLQERLNHWREEADHRLRNHDEDTRDLAEERDKLQEQLQEVQATSVYDHGYQMGCEASLDRITTLRADLAKAQAELAEANDVLTQEPYRTIAGLEAELAKAEEQLARMREAAETARSTIWRRLCKVLLRNDWWCKGLGLTQPKSEAYAKYLKMKKEQHA